MTSSNPRASAPGAAAPSADAVPAPAPPTTSSRKPRTDGVQARERILSAALRLFVERGHAATSVREIAQAAGVNVAAIAYYFGDKAGLYRAALFEPVRAGAAAVPAFDAPGLGLAEALSLYMRACLQPLGHGADALLSVRLRFRESFEPTGMLEDERASRMHLHARLVALLQRHLGLDAPDRELQALAFSLFGLVAYPYYGQDQLRAADAPLLDAPGAADAWSARLAGYAGAMVASEAARRRTATDSQIDDTEPTSTPDGTAP